MEVVINRCFGGFSLSNKAIKRYYELKGEDVFFYKYRSGEYIKTDCDDKGFHINAYSKDFGSFTTEDLYKYCLDSYIRNIDRTDSMLIKVVKELGREANTEWSDLEVVEIPDDVNWEINNNEGMETIEEVHRSWC